MEPLLFAKEVRKLYRSTGGAVVALDSINLEVERGELVAVMGPSGSGKTTMLNCLSGLDDIDSGHVFVDGRDLFAMSDAERTLHRAHAMGFIFQAFNLIPVFNAVENVELPLLLRGTSPKEARRRAVEMLDRVGLGHRAAHKPNEMSGGEQQRVTIARALVGRPAIVWADEPTGNLDSTMADAVMQLLGQLNEEEQQTIVLVTHDSGIGAAARRVVRMRDGHLESDERRETAHRPDLDGITVYSELTPVLLVLLALALGVTMVLVIGSPVLRRLAFRQVARRRTEAVLIISGSILGTALIVSSLSVGDSLDTSIRRVAVRSLGPIDERITTVDPGRGAQIADRLEALKSDPNVDGVLTVRNTVAATTFSRDGVPRAEPITLLWDLDFEEAATFGGSGSGLSGPEPGPGEVVVNDELANRLQARAGDTVTFFVFGKATPMRIVRVVPRHGLAGAGLGAVVNADAFLASGTLERLAAASGTAAHPLTTTLISNRGGVEAGALLSDQVEARIDELLVPAGLSTVVAAAKQDVLDAAEETSGVMGSLFLFIGSFSIIAGILLLVNVFVMLAEERKSQLGMLRAVGLTRRRLVGEFAIEGAVYALIAAFIGLFLGAVIGRGVVGIADTIMNQWNSKSQQLDLAFGISTTSMINGFAAGFVIAFLTVVLTSVRLSRLNVIAAIRDLPAAANGRLARRWVVLSSIVCAFFTAAAIVAVATSAGAAAYLLPALAALAAVPALRLVLSPRAAWTGVSLAILLWSLTANLFRPDVFDSSSMTVYIALGVLVTFSAVLLISQNQNIVLWPVHRLLDRPSETALTARLALAYPTSRRFRTGATLVMYSIVVFVVVLLTQIGAILNASKDQAVADSGAGWTHRVDVNGTLTQGNPIDVLRSGPFAGRVVDVLPLVIGHATASDPGHRTEDALPVTIVGLPDLTKGAHEYLLDQRMVGFDDDEAVWTAVASSPEYVVVDAFFGSGGGPQGQSFHPGDMFTITDPATGTAHIKTIAGVMSSAGAFYNIGVGEFGFPVLTSAAAATADVSDAGVTSFMLDAPGVDHMELVAELQGRFLAAGLVATSIRQTVEQNLAASQSFFRLMQGFLALGLLVGIIGLGVVMVRAVRERRRTIGVLRALGFRATAVQRAFMAESTFIAAEGIMIGAVLAVVTTYLLYRNSAAFQGLHGPYPIAWRDVIVILTATFGASILATFGPAKRASKILPAVAVRVAD